MTATPVWTQQGAMLITAVLLLSSLWLVIRVRLKHLNKLSEISVHDRTFAWMLLSVPLCIVFANLLPFEGGNLGSPFGSSMVLLMGLLIIRRFSQRGWLALILLVCWAVLTFWQPMTVKLTRLGIPIAWLDIAAKVIVVFLVIAWLLLAAFLFTKFDYDQGKKTSGRAAH